ncbi:MAG: hypothetical protein ACTSU3_08505 [Candidatus Thorarchaeota archaeon]
MSALRMVIVVAVACLFFMTITSSQTVSAEGETIVSRGEEFIISITLLQNGSYGNPVPYQPLEFFDQTCDTHLGLALTDANGHASFNLAFSHDHPLGPTLINVTYRGNTSLALSPSYQWTQLIVVSSSTIETFVPTTSLSPSDYLLFSALLKDDSATPISTAILSIFNNDTFLASAITNATGYADFRINCNKSWYNLGVNNILATYGGNLTTFYRASEAEFDVSIIQIPTSIQIESTPQSTFSFNDDVNLVFSGLTNSEYMAFTELDVFLNNNPLTTIITNETGFAFLTFQIDERFNLGPNTLRTRYSGTDRFEQSFCEITLIATSLAILDIDNPEIIEINDYVNITIGLTDELNREITGASITLSDTFTGNNITINSLPNQSTFNFRIFIAGKKGERSFRINIIDNAYLLNTSHSFILPIWASPNLVLTESNIMGYASPLQHVIFELHLTEHYSNLSYQIIEVWNPDNILIINSTTDQTGFVLINFTALDVEGYYTYHIIYKGNISNYILAKQIDFDFSVLHTLPIRVALQEYFVYDSLMEISVHLSIIALNGTHLTGVILDYYWMNSKGNGRSDSVGNVHLQLTIPNSAGVYILSFEVQQIPGILPQTGDIFITVDMVDVNIGQGVGINVLAVCLLASFSIPLIPFLRQRYISG